MNVLGIDMLGKVLRFPAPPPPFSFAMVCKYCNRWTEHHPEATAAEAEYTDHIREAHPEMVQES